MQLILFITAIMVAGAFIVPSCAQVTLISAPVNQTDNVTYVPVSGSITFDPENYNNVKSVTDLTIYARSPDNIDTKTNPAADGTFNMSVPGAGNYSFWVIPAKLDYLNKTTNATYSIEYPDVASPYYKEVGATGLSGLAIPTKTVQTGKPMNATPMPPTLPAASPTPVATPGFTVVAVLAALGAVCALATRKN
jgi:PGF-CTERM protein